MSTEDQKEYSNGEITIVWKPSLCIHSTKCWKGADGLPDVFNPRVKPWINIKGATSEKIVSQVSVCPSGALSSFYNLKEKSTPSAATVVESTHNGPLIIKGDILLKHPILGEQTKSGTTAFCRCGKSANKPFCDGSHVHNNFE